MGQWEGNEEQFGGSGVTLTNHVCGCLSVAEKTFLKTRNQDAREGTTLKAHSVAKAPPTVLHLLLHVRRVTFILIPTQV